MQPNLLCLRYPAWALALACLSPALSRAQEFPTADQLWQLGRNQGHYVTADVLGVGSVTGFYFSVRRRDDGALPLIRNLLSTILADNRIYLCRKQGPTQYAIYAYWDQQTLPPSPTGGVLLEPGEYLVVTDWPKTSVLFYTSVLGGRYASLAHQADYWSLRAGPNSIVDGVDKRGFPVHGIRFTISKRGDGALPVITDMIGRVNDRLLLWRRDNDGTYLLSADWGSTPGARGPEISLSPGTYLLQTYDMTEPMVRHMHVLSGYWAKPPPPTAIG